MLHNNFLSKSILATVIFCFATPLSLLAQGSPDIIWERRVNIDRVNSVIFTPNGDTLISGGSDRLINFWRVSDGALLQTLNTNAAFIHDSSIESLSITPDGSMLASCSYKLVQLWDLPSGTARKLSGHTDWVVGVAFSPDGNLLASASFDTTIRIWRASDGALIKSLAGTGQQRCLAFSPDGTLLATGAGDKAVTIWRVSDWTLVRKLTGHTDDIYTLAFSPDGNTIGSGGYDDTVRLWNVTDGTLKFTLSGNGGNVYGLAFTPDGSRVAYTDGEGSTVKIYRVADGTLEKTFTENVNEVQTMAFSKDGLLGYGRVDTTVILARIDGTATPRARITSPAIGATYNSPANILITASPSKTDGSITQMEFFQDGIKLGEDLTPPFTFAWNDVAAGTYSLTAVDTDTLGGTTTSSAILVTVADKTNSAPTVRITNPDSGENFADSQNITITASASAGAGVASVEFFHDGISLGQDTTSAFSVLWSSVPIGDYVLTAIVTDKNGATATSVPVNISVTEAPPETVKPRVTIASPRSGARLTTPDVILSGTASDNIGVAEVLYSLNSGPFLSANGTVNWETSLTLVPGANVVQVKSVDTSGNQSTLVSRTFTYILSAPITLQVIGSGTISPLRDAQVLEIGKSYSIRAVPARDFVFQSWTGSVSNKTPSFSFIMAQGMTLTATFVPNPFARLKGTYFGLIEPTTPTHQRSGFVRVTTTRTGTCSGKVTLGKNSYSLKGKFAADGSFAGRSSTSSLLLNLLLDLTGDTDQITGSISDGNFTSSLAANRSVNSPENPSPQAGQYTILIPPNPAKPNSPQGNGYGILKVDSSGKTRLAGALADGTKISQSAAISKTAMWPFHVQLYSGNGSILGMIQFRDQVGVSDLDGTVNWFRPENSNAKLFADGFTTQATLLGSTYSPPSGAPVLTVPAGEDNVVVNLGEGDLESELQQPATLVGNNQFVVPNSNSERLRVTVSTSSGALKGSFIHPVTSRTTRHNGVVFQKQNRAEGFFLGTAQSGFVSVVPVGESDFSDTEDEKPPDIIPEPDIIPDEIDEAPVPGTDTETEPVPEPKKKKRHGN